MTATPNQNVLNDFLLQPTHQIIQNTKYIFQNRFTLFTVKNAKKLEPQADNMDIVTQHTEFPIIETKLPPPILVRVVNNFNSFCSVIKEVTNGDQFSCESTTNGKKLSISSADSCHSVSKFLLSNKADFFSWLIWTNQLKKKKTRPFRLVIRNIAQYPSKKLKRNIAIVPWSYSRKHNRCYSKIYKASTSTFLRRF